MDEEMYEHIKTAAYDEELQRLIDCDGDLEKMAGFFGAAMGMAGRVGKFALKHGGAALQKGTGYIDQGNKVLSGLRTGSRHIRNIKRDLMEAAGLRGAGAGGAARTGANAGRWVKPALIGGGVVGAGAYAMNQSSKGGY